MEQPKIGFITFADHRQDMWEKVFARVCIPLHKKAIETLRELPIELIYEEEVSRTREQIDAAVDSIKSRGAQVLIAHTPAWTSPNLVLHGVQRMGLYTVVLGNQDPATHGSVGLFGASGALGQIDYPHMRIREEYDVGIYRKKLLPVLRGAAVKEQLKGSVFGLFGGRSIGIDPATFDPMQWRGLFGIDSEHIDQLEIVRRAELIPHERVDKMRNWLEGGVKEVHYNQDKLTREKFDFQLACYLATKDIVKEAELDFVGLKCMPELSNYYVPQCMTQAFLAYSEDAEGVKESTPIACEADADGALTQQILKLLSGGKPTFFADVSHLDNKRSLMYCVNCGAICAYYAGRNEKSSENLKKIVIKQSVRPGGAGITYFNAAPGEMQLARLYRKGGKYKMAIIPTEAVSPSQELLDEFVAARGPHQLPTLFAKMGFDVDDFVKEYGSNHISGVEGNYVEELLMVCETLGIEPVLFQ